MLTLCKDAGVFVGNVPYLPRFDWHSPHRLFPAFLPETHSTPSHGFPMFSISSSRPCPFFPHNPLRHIHALRHFPTFLTPFGAQRSKEKPMWIWLRRHVKVGVSKIGLILGRFIDSSQGWGSHLGSCSLFGSKRWQKIEKVLIDLLPKYATARG